MVKFGLLLDFHSLLFSEYPQLSPDMHLSPGHYPVVRETRVAQLFKKPAQSHPPLARHQSHV